MTRQDVVEATRVRLTSLGESWGKPDADLYGQWHDALAAPGGHLEKLEKLVQLGEECGLDRSILREAAKQAKPVPREESLATFLYYCLLRNGHLYALRERLKGGVRLLEEVGKEVFPKNDLKAATSLIDLAVQARAKAQDQALLPARYHLFVRALEGAYVAFTPEPRLLLNRHETISLNDAEYAVFEAASCRRCGHLYIAGDVQDDSTRTSQLRHPRISPDEETDVDLSFVVDRPTGSVAINEDEQVEYDIETKDAAEEFKVCNRCAAINQVNALLEPCNCKNSQNIRVIKVRSGHGKQTQCPGCGSRSQNLVVRFLTGQDAANSVLATAPYQRLPARSRETVESQLEPADDWVTGPSIANEVARTGSRKLLAFSDSRQDAAFFACYLDRTYRQILRRRLIVEALTEGLKDGTVWRVQDLVRPVRRLAEEAWLFGPEWSEQERPMRPGNGSCWSSWLWTGAT